MPYRIAVKSEKEKNFSEPLQENPEREIPSRLEKKAKSSRCLAFVGNPQDAVFRELLDLKMPSAALVYIHPQYSAVQEASQIFNQRTDIVFCHESLDRVRIPNSAYDFLCVRNVLEFEPNPRASFDGLMDQLDDRGFFCFEEFDRRLLNHYPISTHLEQQLHEIEDRAKRSGIWQARVGSEIYSFASEYGADHLKTEVIPKIISAGTFSPEESRMLHNWLNRLDAALHSENLNLSFDFDVFTAEFKAYLENPQRFSYSPLVRVSGIKN